MDFELQPNPELSYAGTLLIAHPSMRDPNFARSVVLVSAHDGEEGSMGVIVNRPLGTTLGEQSASFQFSPLADVPIYEGGPVQVEQVILAAWKAIPAKGMFQLYFGLSEEKAVELALGEPETVLRAFRGYAGWGKGQLEAEHQQHAWLVAPAAVSDFARTDGPTFWRGLITKVRPELRFLSDTPEDPSVN